MWGVEGKRGIRSNARGSSEGKETWGVNYLHPKPVRLILRYGAEKMIVELAQQPIGIVPDPHAPLGYRVRLFFYAEETDLPLAQARRQVLEASLRARLAANPA